MEIIREIKGLENNISSLINFFKEIKNFEKIFAEDVASFEVLNENTFRIKIGSFPNISLIHKRTTRDSFSLKSRSDNFDFEILINLSEINMEEALAYVVQGLESGLHPKYITEDEDALLIAAYGEEWFKR